MQPLKAVGILVSALACLFLVVFALNAFGFANFAFFAPKIEAVRRDTFVQSQAYNEGMVRDFQNLQLEYQTADDAHRAGLRVVILQRFAAYQDHLPLALQSFYQQLKNN